VSGATASAPVASRRANRLAALRSPARIWLAVVWVALWGDVTLANVLGGLLVGLVVGLVFPFPPLRMRVHVRPLWLGWLLIHFLGDVVRASAQVAWVTLQFGRQPRNAVIEVDLETDSDLVLTLVAEMVSLVPGSLVVEARRSSHTLFLHVFDARDAAGVERMRRDVFALERRVVLAIGADISHFEPPASAAQRSSEGRSA
jgi:multicomponent Na+:H+ antiporter subunit E